MIRIKTNLHISYSSEENKNKKIDLFVDHDNLDINKPSVDKIKLSDEPNVPVLNANKNKVIILISIEKPKPKI
jgi:hypothetical protein